MYGGHERMKLRLYGMYLMWLCDLGLAFYVGIR
jgi:hypothetical protein